MLQHALAPFACALAASLLACGPQQAHEDRVTPPAPAAPVAPAPKPAPAPAAAASAPAKVSAWDQAVPVEQRVGWSKVVFEDDQLPLCVFSDLVARHNDVNTPSDAKKQTLRAKHSVAFGAFGPGCVNEACDAVPSLQCTADRDGQRITVKARYTAYHKDGSTCADGCRPILAGCETPELEAGTYTVTYGAKTFPLKIPSVLRDPCFVRETP